MSDIQFINDATAVHVGDVVRLRSGGPWMTVNIVRADGHLQVTWIAENGERQFMAMPVSCFSYRDADEIAARLQVE